MRHACRSSRYPLPSIAKSRLARALSRRASSTNRSRQAWPSAYRKGGRVLCVLGGTRHHQLLVLLMNLQDRNGGVVLGHAQKAAVADDDVGHAPFGEEEQVLRISYFDTRAVVGLLSRALFVTLQPNATQSVSLMLAPIVVAEPAPCAVASVTLVRAPATAQRCKQNIFLHDGLS